MGVSVSKRPRVRFTCPMLRAGAPCLTHSELAAVQCAIVIEMSTASARCI